MNLNKTLMEMLMSDIFGGAASKNQTRSAEIDEIKAELQKMTERFPKVSFVVGLVAREEEGTCVGGFVHGRPECVHFAMKILKDHVKGLQAN